MKKKIMGVKGRSLVFNIIFIIVNLIGFSFIAMGWHENFEENAGMMQTIGYFLTIGTLIGLFIFEGYKMFGYVARVIVGGLFIVSGMIKANDPLGFSYKLEEYFEDGALAYRIKALGWETFSLEGLIEYALFFSILICIAEIILGIALLLGAKIKVTLWALFGLTVFFGMLTAHTMDCDPQGTFKDVDYYSQGDKHYDVYKSKIGFEDEKLKVIQEGDQIRVEEIKMLQCVTDCGCFGDALKGSVGRSLTPAESFWKDLILFYLVIIVILSYSGFDKMELRKPINAIKIGLLGMSFVVFWFTGVISPFIFMLLLLSIMGMLAIRETQMNSIIENIAIIPSSAIVILFFSWVFGWYFPLAFAMVVLISNLMIRRSKNEYVRSEWSLALFSVLATGLFVWYVLNYLPMKDYRAYAIGENILENMVEKKPPVIASVYTYKNLSSGEIIELTDADLSNNNYPKDLFDNTKWQFEERKDKILDRGIPAKITDFQPFAYYDSLPEKVRNSAGVQELLNANLSEHFQIDTLMAVIPLQEGIYPDTIPPADFDTTVYTPDMYKAGDIFVKKERIDPNVPITLNFTNYLLTRDQVFFMVCYDIEKTNPNYKDKIKELFDQCTENGIEFFLLSASSSDKIDTYLTDIDPNIPVLSGDDKELKIIVRSNPGYVAISNAVVKGKWSFRAIPTFEEVKKAFEE
ncbi:MAG: hypothetical protein KDC84_11480 [Crocinitomicaceae bacterium]|nr:hypothetical protein [Crocinitomicaceae bacterium]